MRAVVFRIVLALVSLVTALAVAEGVLRLIPAFDPHLGGHERLFTFDRSLGWRFVPGAEETIVFPGEYRQSIRINESGFRDVPWTREGTRRIAILGDSFTSNLGVPVDSVFTRHLERRLGESTVVRNYGVNGYNQVQQAVQLSNDVIDWRPDRVLLVLYPRNDLDENASRHWTAHYERPRATNVGGDLRIQTDLVEKERPVRSRRLEGLRLRVLARTLWYRLNPDAMPVHRQPPERRWSRDEWTVDQRETFDLTIGLVTWMRDHGAETGMDFGVVIAPSLWQVRDDAWERIAREGMVRTQPQRALVDAFEQRGIDVLDLLPALRAAEGRLYYPSEQHWTAAAQPIVAEAIADWLDER